MLRRLLGIVVKCAGQADHGGSQKVESTFVVFRLHLKDGPGIASDGVLHVWFCKKKKKADQFLEQFGFCEKLVAVACRDRGETA